MQKDDEFSEVSDESFESNADLSECDSGELNEILGDSNECDSIESDADLADSSESNDEKIKALEEKYIRAYAEFDNVKKRLEREKYLALEYANEQILKDFEKTSNNRVTTAFVVVVTFL